MQVEIVKYIERDNFDKYEGVYQNNYRLASQTIAFLLITLKRICCPQTALWTTDPPQGYRVKQNCLLMSQNPVNTTIMQHVHVVYLECRGATIILQIVQYELYHGDEISPIYRMLFSIFHIMNEDLNSDYGILIISND